MNRSPLKWVGSKARIMETLRPHLPPGDRLVEPFSGSAAVFLNTNYAAYLLTDINSDLINLFNTIKLNAENFIVDLRYLFLKRNNETDYYQLRKEFNHGVYPYYSALLFLYLNRHCYNGLCRYNRKGGFNVPYGKYKAPYFPEAEIRFFAEKASNATFICCDFSAALAMTTPGDVVYCDPPYIPTSATANFTHYHTSSFTDVDQHRLAVALVAAADNGCKVVVSNSHTPRAADLYARFAIHSITAPRSVSCKNEGRKAASEIIAIMGPGA